MIENGLFVLGGLETQLHAHGPDADVGVEEVVLASAVACYMA